MSNTTGIKYISTSLLNLRCFGAGSMSLALENPSDEFILHLNDEDAKVTGKTYTGRKNDQDFVREKLFSFAAAFSDGHCNARPVSIDINNHIPFAADLGKTEAGIGAIALAMTDIFKIGLDKNQVFALICDICADMDFKIDLSSVASAIFGGIISFDPWSEKKIMKIYCPIGLQISIFVSDSFRTSGSWPDVIHSDQLSANSVSLLYGLMTSDLDIFSQSIRNNAVISALANENNLFDEIMKISIKNGALGAGLSPGGGSIFIIYANTLVKDQNNIAIGDCLKSRKINFSFYDTPISLNGIYKA